MALVIGNTKQLNPNPNGNTYSTGHTQNVGGDGLLLVAVCMANTVNFNNVKYDGVTMTTELNYNSASLGQRWGIFSLQSPSTGNNTIQINFSANQVNSISIFAVSFTGSGGIGNIGNNDVANTPHNRNLLVSQNSVIYAMGVSTFPIQAIKINGSSRPLEFSHNTNDQVAGALSTSLPSGSIAVGTESAALSISNTRIEILEVASVPGISEGNWMMLL